MMSLSYSIYPRRVLVVLVLIAFSLCVLSAALKAHEWQLGVHNTYWAYRLSDLFSTNQEGNIPAWYNALLLLIATVVTAVIAHAKRKNQAQWRRHWTGLAFLLLYLTLDEAAEIHEIFTIPLQESLDIGGPFHFAWIFVGIPFVLIAVAVFLPFVWKLPKRIRLIFLLAGAIYVTGAIGIESISANEWYLNDGPTLLFSYIGAVEEFFEMTGVSVLIYGLLLYARDAVGGVSVGIAPTKTGEDESPSPETMLQ